MVETFNGNIIASRSFAGLRLAQTLGKVTENVSLGPTSGITTQPLADRVKGFCPNRITAPSDFLPHLNELKKEVRAKSLTRITDRAVTTHDMVPMVSRLLPIEAEIKLGGRWDGHSFIMSGQNDFNRRLSADSSQELHNIVAVAQGALEKGRSFKVPDPIPEGYSVDSLVNGISNDDAIQVAQIYGEAFKHYLTSDPKKLMTNPEYIKEWVKLESVIAIAMRDPEGLIVSIAAADLGTIIFDRSREFNYAELGDSATLEEYQLHGLNRNLKVKLLNILTRMGADVIYTEARATVTAVNVANAKCGLIYRGRLPKNSYIEGQKNDVDEGVGFQTMNIWSLTPNDSAWDYYQNLL